MLSLGKALLIASLYLVASISSFGDNRGAWDAFSPPEDQKFDWVQMNSGEWLKGEIKVMYSYQLEFDSDELGLLELDMDDVKIIRSCGSQEILVEKGRREKLIAHGTLLVDGEKVSLTQDDEVQEFKRVQLVSIAKGHTSEFDNWSGSFSLGATARGGNTESLDLNAFVNLNRRTALTRLNMDYIANYSDIRTTDSTGANTKNTTADNHRIKGFFDWFLSSRFYWQVLNLEYYKDPLSNISDQYSGSTGVGYDIMRSSRVEWTVSTGLGFQNTQYDSVAVGDDSSSESPYAMMGTRLDVEVNGDLDFIYDYSARFLKEENGTYTHHMVTTLSYEIISDLDLNLSFIWDTIKSPADAIDSGGNPYIPEKNDYQVVVGLGYSF